MKFQRHFSLVLAVLVSVAALSGAQDDAAVIKRGAELGDAPYVDLADVIRDVESFAGKTVTIEGRVGDVCRMKGCWMGLVPDGAAMGVRVTFEDYGFFVPRDSKGSIARMEGTFHTNVLSKEEADHLEAEGATLARNPDGTVTELSFVANGVELRKAD